MPTIWIIYKQEDTKARDILPQIHALLEQNKYHAHTFCIDELPILENYSRLILLALGGDGTILSLVNHNRKARFPIISINTGTLGFLTTFSLDSWYDSLIPRLREYHIEDVPLLHIISGLYSDIALNEVSITRSGIARNISIQVDIDTEHLYTFAGDGILVATQYGSSAYSRSVGGSLIHPAIQAFIISPIVPLSPSLPALVIPSTAKVSLSVLEGDAIITCDGQRVVPLSSPILIEQAPYTMPFISSIKNTYYSHIQKKKII